MVPHQVLVIFQIQGVTSQQEETLLPTLRLVIIMDNY